jgi:hypothetical protein
MSAEIEERIEKSNIKRFSPFSKRVKLQWLEGLSYTI